MISFIIYTTKIISVRQQYGGTYELELDSEAAVISVSAYFKDSLR